MTNKSNKNESDKTPWKLIGQIMLVIIAIVLIVVFGWRVKSISIFGFGLEPPTTPTSVSQKYDDFNNPLYNNNINSDLWERIQDQNCDVTQEDGIAQFILSGLSENSTLCYLHMPKRVEFNQVDSVISVESNLLAEDHADGDFSIEVVELKTTGFSPNTSWLAQCGIIQTPKENKVELFFWVNNSYPGGDPEILKTMPAATNQWYKMRLEFHAYTGTIWCFENDKVLGNHEPTRIDILKSQLFSRHITAYWSANSNAVFQADDVIVKP